MTTKVKSESPKKKIEDIRRDRRDEKAEEGKYTFTPFTSSQIF